MGGREKRRFLDARELPKLPLLLLGGHLDHPGLVDDPRRPETRKIERDSPELTNISDRFPFSTMPMIQAW